MVRYFSEDIEFNFKGRRANNRWLSAVASGEGRKIGEVNVVFCSDPYLLDVNRKYLGHDYYTDIITFDYCEGPILSGDLFISIDSVRENALFYGTSFDEELHRVIVHGILHLVGYDDGTDEEKKTMREKEDAYLSIRDSFSVV